MIVGVIIFLAGLVIGCLIGSVIYENNIIRGSTGEVTLNIVLISISFLIGVLLRIVDPVCPLTYVLNKIIEHDIIVT